MESNINLKDKRDKVIAYFKKHWKYLSTDHADDFGSWCVEKWLNGKGIESSFNHLAIDYLRNNFHFDEARKYTADALASNKKAPIESIDLKYEGISALEGIEFKEIIRQKKLSALERAIMILYYEWGFLDSEIADCFGMSEAYTGNVRRETVARLKTNIPN